MHRFLTIVACVVLFAHCEASALNLNTQIQDYKHDDQLISGISGTDREPFSSSAPEPNTLILLFGGFTGVIVRFMRKSFEELKRLFDIVLSVVGLTVSLPILLYAMFMIKFDSPGPVIYRQRRVGKDARVFDIFKLRTMQNDAEKGSGPVWARKNDPRVTQVGRVLRKLRIDEIPQLFNVLKGDMSIIGPRPERPEIVERLKKIVREYEDRLKVKPGITGMAQVLHKYDETLDDVKTKVKFDQQYMQSMSLSTDFKILARTFLVVATGKGAR
ncbi:MAG: sugar transferase [Deltaproteobacteria bacterium]